MKKFLLSAVIALLGISAFAQKPDNGAEGYLYNADTKTFISGDIEGADGLMHATTGTTGMKFKVIIESDGKFRFETGLIQSKDTNNGGANANKATRLSRCENNAENRITTTEYNGWSKWELKAEEGKGFRLANNYAGSGDNFAKGCCISIAEDGTLTLVPEADAPYWQFVDQATYDELSVLLSLNTKAPENGAVGYLYNPDAKTFIFGDVEGADGMMHATTGETGMKFTVIIESDGKFRFETGLIQSKDTNNGGANANKATRLSRCENNAENRITTTEYNGWSKWELKAVEGKGFRLANNYAGTGSDFAKGCCISIAEDGTLTLLPEADAPYWVFVDEETYAKLVPASEPEPVVVTFDFNKSSHATSSNSSTDGDITATETLIEEGVTLAISPAEEGKTTPNRYWGTNNGPQLRMYSGYMKLTAPEGKAIVAIEINTNGKWSEKNAFNGKESAASAWAGNCSEVAIDIAGNTQMNSIAVTLADADEATEGLPTAISFANTKKAANVIFNVAGQQMKNLQKGLNIVGGKKVLVK